MWRDLSRRAVYGSGNWRAKPFRGSDVLQAVGRMVCTWRAPSSPHLACRLNGSIFLRPCGPLSAAQAGRLHGVLEGPETCGTLQGWMFCATLIKHARTAEFCRCLGKKVSFF